MDDLPLVEKLVSGLVKVGVTGR